MVKAIAIAACAVGGLLVLAGLLGPSQPTRQTDFVEVGDPLPASLQAAADDVEAAIMMDMSNQLRYGFEDSSTLSHEEKLRHALWSIHIRRHGSFLDILTQDLDHNSTIEALNLNSIVSIRLLPGLPTTHSKPMAVEIYANSIPQDSGTQVTWFVDHGAIHIQEFKGINYSRYGTALEGMIRSGLPEIPEPRLPAEDDQIRFDAGTGGSGALALLSIPNGLGPSAYSQIMAAMDDPKGPECPAPAPAAPTTNPTGSPSSPTSCSPSP